MFFKHRRKSEPDTGLVINKENALTRSHLAGPYFHSIPGFPSGEYTPPEMKIYVQHSTIPRKFLGKSSANRQSGGAKAGPPQVGMALAELVGKPVWVPYSSAYRNPSVLPT